MGLVENGIYIDARMALVAIICQPGARRQVVLRCINIMALKQDLLACSLVGIFLPLEEKQLCNAAVAGIVAVFMIDGAWKNAKNT